MAFEWFFLFAFVLTPWACVVLLSLLRRLFCQARRPDPHPALVPTPLWSDTVWSALRGTSGPFALLDSYGAPRLGFLSPWTSRLRRSRS